MKKIDGNGLNETAISLSALKQSDNGDEVVILWNDGSSPVGWYAVENASAIRGPKGGTTLSLRDLSNDVVSTYTFRMELPAGMARVRRVSAGVNSRSLRQVPVAPVKTPAAAIVQPPGEIANILDLPDEEPEAESSPAVATETAPEATETAAPAESVANTSAAPSEPVLAQEEVAVQATLATADPIDSLDSLLTDHEEAPTVVQMPEEVTIVGDETNVSATPVANVG